MEAVVGILVKEVVDIVVEVAVGIVAGQMEVVDIDIVAAGTAVLVAESVLVEVADDNSWDRNTAVAAALVRRGLDLGAGRSTAEVAAVEVGIRWGFVEAAHTAVDLVVVAAAVAAEVPLGGKNVHLRRLRDMRGLHGALVLVLQFHDDRLNHFSISKKKNHFWNNCS